MNIQPLAVTTDLMTAFYEGAFRSDDNQIFAPQRESRGTDVIEKSRRFGVQHGERFY
jgi:hypothetical protein